MVTGLVNICLNIQTVNFMHNLNEIIPYWVQLILAFILLGLFTWFCFWSIKQIFKASEEEFSDCINFKNDEKKS